MKRLGGQTRRQLFERLDEQALNPLPATPYVYSEWSSAKVHLDYHVELERHYYSVPYTLVHEVLDVRMTGTAVELLHKGRRVASHVRSHQEHAHTTNPEHMPANHRAWLESDPAQVLSWASSVGPCTEAFAQKILVSRPIAQQGLRSALGLMRVGKKHEPVEVEHACELALTYGARSYKHVERILKLGWQEPETDRAIDHGNIRGPEYFH